MNPYSGKVIIAVIAAMAEAFLDNLSEETCKGKRARAEAGLPNGDLPYGYHNPDAGTDKSGPGIGNKTAATIDGEQAKAVRRAFELYATGRYSDALIARTLNAEGYIMVSKRQPHGGTFQKDTICAMLQNPFYAGAVTLYGEEVQDASGAPVARHEAIISRELFDRAQAVRKGRARTNGVYLQQKYQYVAAGLLRCRCCKTELRGHGRGTAYRNPSGDLGRACSARRKSIAADVVARDLDRAVAGLVLPDDWQQ